MGVRAVKQCHICKEKFRREELIDYAAPGTKSMYSYCPECFKKKQAKERFSNKVCSIFGLKSPGPRIWKERQRLQDTYGYTDDTIIDCLDYIYCVEKKKKLAESLCLVQPYMVEKMMKYKARKEHEAMNIVRAAKTEVKEYIVPIKENTTKKKESLNPDDWLED